MRPEVQAAIAEAVEPLQKQIEQLKVEMAALIKCIAPPPSMQEAQFILSNIPRATMKALGVLQISYDQKLVWFQLVCQNGTRISVRKQSNGFRVRVRDKEGMLLRELKSPLNGLNAALASLA
jgi:hypothetical protein